MPYPGSLAHARAMAAKNPIVTLFHLLYVERLMKGLVDVAQEVPGNKCLLRQAFQFCPADVQVSFQKRKSRGRQTISLQV
jgi:hypothetical protein